MSTPFSKISVSDICELCGMHRKSFYYHFRDKYDLVNWIFYHDFVEIAVKNQPASFTALYCGLSKYFYENRVFYKNALSVGGQNSFGDYYKELFEAAIKAYFEDKLPEGESLNLVAQYYSEVSLISLSKWLKSNSCLPPDEYMDLMRSAIKSMLKIAPKLDDE